MTQTIVLRLAGAVLPGEYDAEEFAVSDARALAEQCRRAFEAILARARVTGSGDIRRAPYPPTLELHVWDPTDRGWYAPTRPHRHPQASVPLVVRVSRETLDRRPPDDWTEIFGWCAHAIAVGRQYRLQARRVATCAYPPAEIGDADRRRGTGGAA